MMLGYSAKTGVRSNMLRCDPIADGATSLLPRPQCSTKSFIKCPQATAGTAIATLLYIILCFC